MDGINTIIADADSIIALVNTDDSLHTRAVTITQYIEEKQIHVVFPITAIAEAVTKIQRVFSNPTLTKSVVDLVYSNTEAIIDITPADYQEAKSLFDPYASKKNTFFDAIVAAVARNHGITTIFSFDQWYQKNHLTLIEDILPPQ